MRMRHHGRGFTLIELMFVVVIIGVLSVIAVSGWRKHILAARAAEATNLLGAVRAAQETYFQAFGQYCGNVQAAAWPAQKPEEKADWGTPPANSPWAQLGLHSPGKVWFQYFLAAGSGNNLPPGAAPFLQADRDGRPWYWAWAENDFGGGDRERRYFEVTSRTSGVFEAQGDLAPNN